jgi:predicted nucleic acid-binding protein
MNKRSIIPDSTFYICYLDDIKQPKFIVRILENDCFEFFTGPVIKGEIEKSKHHQLIKKTIEDHVQLFTYYQYGEVLRPFFSIGEIKKGENEVIVISYILFSQNRECTVILDDDSPRKFLQNHFPILAHCIEGTVGFTKNCHLKYRILQREETLSILTMIQQSKFRVNKEIVEEAMSQIRRSVDE